MSKNGQGPIRQKPPLKKEKAVKSGMNVSLAVKSAVNYLSALENAFEQAGRDKAELYSLIATMGTQSENVDSALSGRLFNTIDYYINDVKENKKITGFISYNDKDKNHQNLYQFKSEWIVEKLAKMLETQQTKDIHPFLDNIAATIESNEDWKSFWRARREEGQREVKGKYDTKTIQSVILAALVYKMVGESEQYLPAPAINTELEQRKTSRLKGLVSKMRRNTEQMPVQKPHAEQIMRQRQEYIFKLKEATKDIQAKELPEQPKARTVIVAKELHQPQASAVKTKINQFEQLIKEEEEKVKRDNPRKK